MDTNYSFSKAVLVTAWRNSRTLLRSRAAGIATLVVSLFVGAIVQWRVAGLSMDALSLAVSVACAVATAAVVFAAKFFWHLFLAPSEIIRDEVRPILEGAAVLGVPRSPNYSIWCHRKFYNAAEFASLLVDLDPGSSQTVDYRSMQCLVLEGLRSGDLKYSMPYGMAAVQPPGYLPDISVLISKEEALNWADRHGLGSRVISLR